MDIMLVPTIELFWGLNEIIHVKHLDQSLTFYKYASYYYYEIIISVFE